MKIVYVSMGEKYILKKLIEAGFDVAGVAEPQKGISDGRRNTIRAIKKVIIEDLSTVSRRHKIPFLSFSREQYALFENFLLEKKPELVVVYSMPFLIRRSTLETVGAKFVNIHPSYLPNYRGPNPWVYQFLDHPGKIGYTIHFIDPGEDTGDILFQEYITVGVKNFEKIYREFIKASSNNLLRILKELNDGKTMNVVHQPRESPTKRANRVSDAWSLIDFSSIDAERLYVFLRNAKSWIPRLNGYSVIHFRKADHTYEPGYIKNHKIFMNIYTKDGYVRLIKKIPH